MCKGELIVAHGSAITYRLAGPDEPPAATRPGRRRAVLVGIGILVGGTLATLALFRTSEPGKQNGAMVQHAQFAQLPPPRPAPPAAAPQREEAAPQQQVRTEAPPVDRDRLAALPVRPASRPQVAEVKQPAQPEKKPQETAEQAARRAEEELRARLERVPELDLDNSKEAKSATGARERIAKLAKTIQEKMKGKADGFVLDLIEKRADLAGLPFLKGKDCTLDKGQARTLAEMSQTIRACLDDAVPGRSSGARVIRPPSDPGMAWYARPDPDLFWSQFSSASRGRDPKAIPALQQLLAAEHHGMRLSLVAHLGKTRDKVASATLARAAVFDLNPQVRQSAVSALMDRPAEEHRGVLLDALRHPWGPAATHAGQALARLRDKGAVPELLRLLDEPEPTAPLLKKVGGKEVAMVRELVRINHLRNCLLCHAPSPGSRDILVQGPVPVPGQELPPVSSTVYYSARRGETLVRADVTYLRQDFSAQMLVPEHGNWPEMQRYDFVVRTRPLTKAELLAWAAREQRVGPEPLSEHRQAVLHALREITGLNAPPSAQAWLDALARQPEHAGFLWRNRTP
jgi:hypothetical protein